LFTYLPDQSNFYVSAAYVAADALCFCFVGPGICPGVCPVPSVGIFLSFWNNNGFRWNLQEITNTTNRLNDWTLGEIGIGTREQDMTENSNRRQPVFQTGAGA